MDLFSYMVNILVTMQSSTSHTILKMTCELHDLGWASVDICNEKGPLDYWNETVIRKDILSFPPYHQVSAFFMEANPKMTENWMESCEAKTVITLMEKLFMKKYCANVYTDEEKVYLKEIMDRHGPIIAKNMCIRTLFGVGCECNDFEGNPFIRGNDDSAKS